MTARERIQVEWVNNRCVVTLNIQQRIESDLYKEELSETEKKQIEATLKSKMIDMFDI